jgi:hypothetical protein
MQHRSCAAATHLNDLVVWHDEIEGQEAPPCYVYRVHTCRQWQPQESVSYIIWDRSIALGTDLPPLLRVLQFFHVELGNITW